MVFENVLLLVGAFIGLSIAFVAIKGYRETRSPTLLRLATAFTLLFAGFIVDALIGFSGMGYFPQLALTISVLISVAAFLQAAGYFFLAFSHAIDVRVATRLGIIASIGLPLLNLPAAFHSLSLFFLLYGTAETAISYVRMRKTETLVISCGLALIALSMFLTWISYLYPADPLILLFSLIAKVFGFSTLLVPVLRFSFPPEVETE